MGPPKIDSEMIEGLEHLHLTPHALLIPLLRNGLECDLARDVLRRGRGGGIWRSHEGGGMAWMGQLRGAQRGSSVLVVRAMSRAANAMTMMWGL